MWWISLRLGLLLGWRQLQRANKWITILIIFVMMIVFLNLVVVSGILIGLIEGGNQANRNQYTGDVIITTLSGETAIINTPTIMQTLESLPRVTASTARYLSGATIEANYQNRRDFSADPDQAGTQLAGINIDGEESLSHISDYVVEGSYLEAGQEGYVLLGANLLQRYSSQFGDGFDSLGEVYPGDRVKVTVGNVTKEMIVKGIVDSKVGEVSIRAFIPDREFLRLTGRTTQDANEIAINHDGNITDAGLKDQLVRTGFDRYGKIQTADEAIPQFLIDIKDTFSILGNVFGAIGLIVAMITVFIVVYINAITRRKYIGILKAIGVSRLAIEIAYIVQSLFYAILGSLVSSVLIYVVLVPGFQKNPLDFPFSDGILVAPIEGTLIRFLILLIVTLAAGFIPAWLISRQNTLDSILGR